MYYKINYIVPEVSVNNILCLMGMEASGSKCTPLLNARKCCIITLFPEGKM